MHISMCVFIQRRLSKEKIISQILANTDAKDVFTGKEKQFLSNMNIAVTVAA